MKAEWIRQQYHITPTTRSTIQIGVSIRVKNMLTAMSLKTPDAESQLVAFLMDSDLPPAELDGEPVVHLFTWQERHLALVYGTLDGGEANGRQIEIFRFVTIFADEIADCLADIFKKRLNVKAR